MSYWQYYLMGIILLPGIILAAIAQARVYSNFKKYEKVFCSKEITANSAVEKILEKAKVYGVQVVPTSGELTDNYDSRSNTISLSNGVYGKTTISALGIAAHEAGHAIQYAENYFPMKLRSLVIKVSNFASVLLWPLVIIGLICNFAVIGGLIGDVFLWCGVAFFGLSVIFELITLPVEYNASKRALKLLVETDCLDQMEVIGARKVLNSAALTYVAALLVAVLNLIRFIAVVGMNSRDR